MLADQMKTKEDEVIFLLEGVMNGTLKVAGYTSEWRKKGPGNRRKMTILVDDNHFDKWGHRIRPDPEVSELYDEYKRQKAVLEMMNEQLRRHLKRMVENGEAKDIDGPDEMGYLGIIVTRDKELMDKIVSWDIDDDGDIVFYFDSDYEPIRCDNVELW